MALRSTTSLHYFPIAVALTLNITLALSYTIALRLDHILPFYAYVSDTGNFAPESCVFGLGFSITGFLLWICGYIRYFHVDSFLDENSFQHEFPMESARRWNRAGMIIALITGLGPTIVGAFQFSAVFAIHVVGAAMGFGGGAWYLIVQGRISKMLGSQFEASNKLVNLRIFIGVVIIILSLATVITGYWALNVFDGETIFKWGPHHAGYAYRVPSVIMEWAMIALFEVALFTFVPEYKKLSYEPPRFRKIVNVNASMDKIKNGNSPSALHEEFRKLKDDASQHSLELDKSNSQVRVRNSNSHNG